MMLTLRLTKIILVALALLQVEPAFAMKVEQKTSGSEESLILTCALNDGTCQSLCQNSHECVLATNTCENCASAEDLNLIGLFKDLDTIYTRSANPIKFSSFQKWMLQSKKVFIDKNSTLDILNGPDGSNSTSWAEKLNVICGISGPHQILADAGAPVQPAVLICDNGGAAPYFYKLKYRTDYTSEILQNSLTEQLSQFMLWPMDSLKSFYMNTHTVQWQKP